MVCRRIEGKGGNALLVPPALLMTHTHTGLIGSISIQMTTLTAFITLKTVFFIYIFYFSVWQSHLATFFHYSQIEAKCHLYWFDIVKMTISLFKATMAEISLLLARPQGCQGCRNMQKNPLNNILMVWSANIEPKLRNIWKTVRKHVFLMIFFSILTAFCSFYNFGRQS
jgi:hypothetical protein